MKTTVRRSLFLLMFVSLPGWAQFSPSSDVGTNPASDNANLERLASQAEGSGNIMEAVSYWEKARDGGSVVAAKHLVQLYSRGADGMSYDYAKAIKAANIAENMGVSIPVLPHK